jgi:hypothetical protein
LIDKTLLLTEASTIDLENDPEFLAAIAKEAKSRILALYQKQEISDSLDEKMRKTITAFGDTFKATKGLN